MSWRVCSSSIRQSMQAQNGFYFQISKHMSRRWRKDWSDSALVEDVTQVLAICCSRHRTLSWALIGFVFKASSLWVCESLVNTGRLLRTPCPNGKLESYMDAVARRHNCCHVAQLKTQEEKFWADNNGGRYSSFRTSLMLKTWLYGAKLNVCLGAVHGAHT